VVVVTRDRPALLEAMLAYLDAQTWQPRETVVVDHGNTPEVEEIAHRHHARYVGHPNGTLAQARQAGVDAAQGEVVAFTDDDCLPRGDWLEHLVRALADGRLWGVQGRTEPQPGPIGSYAVKVHRGSNLYETCNIAYRREALSRCGGFDPRFRGWFEDTALAARVLDLGPIGFEPTAIVMHRAMPRRRKNREEWRCILADERLLARAYPRFYRRHRGPGFLPTVVARWLIGSALKAAWRDLGNAPRNPRGYAQLLNDLGRERVELLRALLLEVRQPTPPFSGSS
jgi:GT2 family glycosyltransferase